MLLVLVGLASALAIATSTPRATAGPPCAARYTIKNDVVLDNDTQLTWQRNFGKNLTLDGATDYCKQLTLDGGGFRVPTVFDLQTIVDESQSPPVINNATFPLKPEDDIFWSETPRVDLTDCKVKGCELPDCKGCNWYVNFRLTTYELVDIEPVNKAHDVRCVR